MKLCQIPNLFDLTNANSSHKCMPESYSELIRINKPNNNKKLHKCDSILLCLLPVGFSITEVESRNPNRDDILCYINKFKYFYSQVDVQ